MATPATSLIHVSDAKVRPSALATRLARDSLFTEVGWVFPNER